MRESVLYRNLASSFPSRILCQILPHPPPPPTPPPGPGCQQGVRGRPTIRVPGGLSSLPSSAQPPRMYPQECRGSPGESRHPARAVRSTPQTETDAHVSLQYLKYCLVLGLRRRSPVTLSSSPGDFICSLLHGTSSYLLLYGRLAPWEGPRAAARSLI